MLNNKQISFEEEIRLEHNSRVRQEAWQREQNRIRGVYIYSDFCIWCNCQGREDWKKNAKMFARWLKETDTELTFYQRKNIAENYFGFVYNEETETFERKEI